VRPRPLLAAALGVLTAGVAAAVTYTAPGVAVAAIHPDSIVLVRSTTAGPPVVLDEGDLAPTTTTAPTSTTAPPSTTPPTTAAPSPTTEPQAAPAPTTAPSPAPPPPPAPASPPPPPAPSAADVDGACERDLFDRTNAARVQNGLAPLAFDGRPHGVARDWSRQMAAAGRMSHNPDLGGDLSRAGVDWQLAGENVGRGPGAVVFAMWMDSPTHRANILEPDFDAFAVACIASGEDRWITQVFYG